MTVVVGMVDFVEFDCFFTSSWSTMVIRAGTTPLGRKGGCVYGSFYERLYWLTTFSIDGNDIAKGNSSCASLLLATY